MLCQREIALDEVNKQRRVYSRLLSGKELELHTFEINAGEILGTWVSEWEKAWRILEGKLVNVIRPSVFTNCTYLSKLDSTPSTEARRYGSCLS